MATRRHYISTIRSSFKILSNDSLLNDRSIFAEIKAATSFLVKQETNKRKLWATDTLFTTLPCLEMEEVPITECCSYESECSVSRSKHKLPKIAEGNYQYVIQGVWSINVLGGKGKKLKEITINRYLNLLKLPIIKKEEYFWIIDDYLYCSNYQVKALRVAAYFEEDISNDLLFPECDCVPKKYTTDQLCKNPLDLEFALPGYLSEQVLDIVSKRLLNTYYRMKEDKTSDSIDGQAVNSPPNS